MGKQILRDMKILAIIPARGGSKGVPLKNIRKLNRKPLIEYTIKSAKKSKYVNRVIVSTDDKKIARIAKSCGAEIPFIRPKHLGVSSAKTIDVVKHTLNVLKKKFQYEPDIVTLLNPTVPFRNEDSIDESIQVLVRSKADITIQVKEIKTHPYRAYWLKNGFLKPFRKDFLKFHQRQLFPECYYSTAGISTFWNKNIAKFGHMFGPKIKPIISSNETNVDIDSIFDFFVAEMIAKYWKNYKV